MHLLNNFGNAFQPNQSTAIAMQFSAFWLCTPSVNHILTDLMCYQFTFTQFIGVDSSLMIFWTQQFWTFSLQFARWLNEVNDQPTMLIWYQNRSQIELTREWKKERPAKPYTSSNVLIPSSKRHLCQCSTFSRNGHRAASMRSFNNSKRNTNHVKHVLVL